jgi:hypothetical protein
MLQLIRRSHSGSAYFILLFELKSPVAAKTKDIWRPTSVRC